MRRFSSLAPALLVGLLLVSPSAAAVGPIFPNVLDDKIGEVHQSLDDANSTYGEREEFQRSAASLARASLSLGNVEPHLPPNNASIVAQDSLVKAAGGLETGKARAQAGGQETGQDVVDHGRQLASQARTDLQQVRNSLESMEKTGLEPVAFSGGLTAAYAANRALDMLDQYEQALKQWERDGPNEDLEASIVTSAAGAHVTANVASDVLERVAEKRANATDAVLLSHDELEQLREDRVEWTNANAGAIGRQSRERVNQLADQDEDLMTLSAYTTHFQNLAFNGLRQQLERGKTDEDPHETARDLYNETKPAVEAWLDTLNLPGDIPVGALESARLTLELNQNATGKNYETSGAFALGLVHLGVEHVGLLQQAYGGEAFEPGTELATASIGEASESDPLAVPVPALAALAALAVGAVGLRRETR